MASKKKKWYSEFEDGYQFGDIYKTMRATGRDVATNLFAGAAGIAEKAIDAGAYVAGGVGGLFGADEFKNKTAKFIKKDIIDEEKVGGVIGDIVGSSGINALIDRAVLGEDYRKKYDNYSVLGEKSDSLVQSGGQLAAQIGLQAAKVPWWVTTGVTSFGSGAEEALNEGATYGQAGVNGAIRAGADILTEKLFAGSGLGEKGIFKLDGLTKGITNKAVKAFADWGIDLLAEGEEEKLAAVFTRLGDMLTTERDYTWKELLTDEKAMDDYLAKFVEYLTGEEAKEEYKEARIGGMVLGGGANLSKVSKSINNKTDYRTGLTANEESVFDKVYESKIAEAKNGGNNLTRKQKAEIYDNTLQQVKNGEVDVQTIEAALGGEDYSTYKNVLNNYSALQQKLNELQAIANKAKTPEQTVKEQEIKQRLEQTKIQANKLKNILQNKVAEKIDIDNIHLKDRESYLWDSYVGKLPNFANDNLNNAEASQKIDVDAFVEGLWNDGRSNEVSKSSESVENVSESGIIEEAVDKDTGVPGEYTDEIVWQGRNIPARKDGKGYRGPRTKQHNERVNNYELKLNPDNESYFLDHPDGKTVQFENMKNGIVQDCKLVMDKDSIYYVKEKIPILNKNILKQASRQLEAANSVGYKVEWLVSDQKAVDQLRQLFNENNLDIIVTYYPE